MTSSKSSAVLPRR